MSEFDGIAVCIKTHIKDLFFGRMEYIAGNKYFIKTDKIKEYLYTVVDIPNSIQSAYIRIEDDYVLEHFITVAEYRKSIIDSIE